MAVAHLQLRGRLAETEWEAAALAVGGDKVAAVWEVAVAATEESAVGGLVAERVVVALAVVE